jgi:hypothetical protein
MAVGTSNYPTSLDTVVELIQAANNAQTTLNGALTANATTVAVISTALFANTGCFAVDNELISYTGKTGTSFTGCVRGFDGSTAATHNSGSTVSDVVTTRHHEVVVDAILALQQKLGSGVSTPSAGTVLKGTGAGSSAFGAITAGEIDLTNAITNAMVNSSAAIAYSKLNLTNSIVNADVASGAAVAYSKLALTGSIVNADVATGAAIDYGKLAALTADRMLVSSGAGEVSASTLTWNATDSAIGALKAIDFTGVTTTPAPLRLQWNTDLATAQIGLTSTVTLPIGQTEVVHVKRSTNNGLAKGKVVYVVGSDGANKTVAYAQANSANTTKTTLGIIAETVSGGAKAFCVTSGLCLGLTTTGLTEGAPIYLSSSSAGDLVLSVPTQPNHRVRIGYCIKEHATDGVIYVDVQTGYDVGELCDVSATAPVAAGSTLIRNATTGVWTAATLTAGSGVTITNGDGAITIASTGAAAGSAGDYQINTGGAFGAGVLSQANGRLTSTATAAASGVVPYLRLITPTDTGLTASTEAPGIVFGGDASGATVTRTRAAGAVTTQREYIFTAPTYAAASATTITTAATLAITGAPVAGSNATLTNRYALLVESDSAANRFQNNTTAIGHQLDLYNANASGNAGIRAMNTDTTIGYQLLYSKSDDAVRLSYASGISGTRIFQIDNSEVFTIGTANGTAYAAAFNATPSNEAQVTVRTNSSGSQTRRGIRIDHGAAAGGSTVGALEIRRESGGAFDERYRFFLNATESNARITDSHGGTQIRGTLTENVTLSTVGATTDTTIQIPANSLVLGVTVRVTTGITGIDSTALQIGDATTAARFGSIAAFTAGTTGVGLSHLQGGISTDAAGPIVTSATAVRLTLSGGTDNTPSAGAVRVTIHYIALTAPTS